MSSVTDFRRGFSARARDVVALATGVLVAAGALAASAQHQHHHRPAPPEGWKFSWPAGDSMKGRDVFVKFECYKCHEVQGESFPGGRVADLVGPELSHMAGHHPPEFFAESIVNPNAVIDEGADFKGPDGSSKMPSFNDSMTVQEVVDLVAYLVNLKPPGADDHKH